MYDTSSVTTDKNDTFTLRSTFKFTSNFFQCVRLALGRPGFDSLVE